MISAALTLVAATATAGWFGDCDHTEPRNASAPTAGVTRIVIIGRAGELRVTGARGVGEARAKGTACASDRDMLSKMTLTATRSGSGLRIEADMPESDFWGGSRTLDFEVIVPDDIPLRIDDTSGELTVENTGPADIHDRSGALRVRSVAGDLSIDDTSGEISVAHVTGRVTIVDTSGSIDVEDAGEVEIPSDSSGSVDVRHVRRNVTIGSKGSGAITVSDVGGDFTVRHKGSGAIDYERVAGRVDVPQRHRDRD